MSKHCWHRLSLGESETLRDREILEAYPELTQIDLNNAWFYAETFPAEIEQAISANET